MRAWQWLNAPMSRPRWWFAGMVGLVLWLVYQTGVGVAGQCAERLATLRAGFVAEAPQAIADELYPVLIRAGWTPPAR